MYFHTEHVEKNFMVMLVYHLVFSEVLFSLSLIYRGWLSGKLKRGMSAPDADSRVAWSAGRAHHSHPDWNWFCNNDQAWTVLDKVEEIGKTHSKHASRIIMIIDLLDLIYIHVPVYSEILYS